MLQLHERRSRRVFNTNWVKSHLTTEVVSRCHLILPSVSSIWFEILILFTYIFSPMNGIRWARCTCTCCASGTKIMSIGLRYCKLRIKFRILIALDPNPTETETHEIFFSLIFSLFWLQLYFYPISRYFHFTILLFLRFNFFFIQLQFFLLSSIRKLITTYRLIHSDVLLIPFFIDTIKIQLNFFFSYLLLSKISIHSTKLKNSVFTSMIQKNKTQEDCVTGKTTRSKKSIKPNSNTSNNFERFIQTGKEVKVEENVKSRKRETNRK